MDDIFSPILDLQTGEGRDPRLRALEEMVRQGQGQGQVIDPNQMRGQMRAAPVLPEEFVPEQRYRGPEISPDDLPRGPADPYEDERRLEEMHKYLDSLPPHVGERYRAYNDGQGPATDSEYDAVFGKGATERSMRGGDLPLYDRGFAKGQDPREFPRRRRRNEPPSERFMEETMGSGEYMGDRRD